ncbi:hypothetical protein IU438_11500 [Nocardia cyriacigeorgica]|uniref:DUF6412 domain-containing protein n=1 Tax=Nocardia cyriacigeorgica TaxID=135487 RepID=UPI0018933E27|nr:DUF6412 domain-containing protein [Nocardia cyriacigeorgica]MBF6088134.1 hypothetical protein [Nocardia cyriacigeorgica]MBF6095244.1 hypothetical protein [Nocardia cyriacigeorgica]MBF6396418.1 hypothetical protein [Nocardia cyriacigeorgica]MBF6402050.1 hypothetical protein [Nocardia cyriacigeorgica]MBF6497235.1 hypothetical protein [Nocardia cyriacigeorgica]
MFTRAQLTVGAVLTALLPALVLLTAPVGEPAAIFGAVAVVLAVALVSAPAMRLVAVAVGTAGPPQAAQRRRRGSYLRQSNPDAAGRPRPRAPGFGQG